MQIISLKTHGRRTLQIATRVSASLLVLALGFPAAASGTDQPANSSLRPVKRFKRWIQVGQASWYGLKFQGSKTATGESYDMNQLHLRAPQPSSGKLGPASPISRTRSPSSSASIDRGPALNGRIVDLSYAAAKAVGLAGIGKVRLDSMRKATPNSRRPLLAQMKMPLLSPVHYPLFSQ